MSAVTGKLRSLFALPDFEDEELAREARLANLIAITFAVASPLYVLMRVLTSSQPVPLVAVVPPLTVAALSVLGLVLIRSRIVRLPSILMVAAVWLAVAQFSAGLGGLSDSGFAGFMMVVVMAGLLRGWQLSLGVVGATMVFGWWLIQAEANAVLLPHTDTAAEAMVNYFTFFAITAGLVAAASGDFQLLLRRLQSRDRETRSRNWELQQMRDSLEARVAERTADLNQRSRYLEAAAQVAYASGEILDIEELMDRSVHLIQDAFGLYYVGFFLVDASHEWAELRAGTGEAGRAMIARHHRIRVGDGMVGWCIDNGESRYAQRAQEDVVRLAATELPDTRAEAALPLRTRGDVLGALTVQSAEADYFDDATVTVLQTMADLLAVALSNAELHAESQLAVSAVRRAYGEVAAEAWDELLRGREDWGYQYADGIIRPASGTWDSQAQSAVDRGELVTDGTGVAVPLRVGGQVVGAISYRRDEGEWGTEDIATLSTLADQLSQSLDSARLLEDSQRLAARERQIGDISARLADAVDIETMLRTAAQELGRLPGVLETGVHLDIPEAVPEDRTLPAAAPETSD